MTLFTSLRFLLPISLGILFTVVEVVYPRVVNAMQATSVSSSQPVQDKEIFNNGSPDLISGREATVWIQAEDFVIKENTILNSIKFWTVESPESIWDGTIEYSLFYDRDGTPDTQPFISGYGVDIFKKSTGRALYGYYNEFAYTFDLATPVNLLANNKYWLGLHLSSNFELDGIYWETTSGGFGLPGISAYEGDTHNWSREYSEPVERAFVLMTKSHGDSRSIPEPSMILGTVIVAGTILRRQMKKHEKDSD
ncbi:PEP-CTERM sorting domain-containing protein [Calothrix sp. UHCC 0171]|uniref:PEP-CTERM sorting domain-containing protein n=1 Tax=Calothrix sp. UHCC 0171 TaxID=3110245 RepID=UPI002B1FA077|nr:PEP-CTERM sorting domain-containing protein [Calothrix sp. UHCC 0171]MEA5571188.1 PEP-CTERM sorting domain-containing protein [Calothrix sp. UHCC 0171]